ncbi:hypothetical protein [uncultured Polaribacter sp.]|uniref:DUF6970 domain-containing protein n=1 Tax=uncultured Polaribacter sp. TaxID=174711 RepID=UPI00262755D8|nr:hypothetical protein [uncultured Polaribacter sp.]
MFKNIYFTVLIAFLTLVSCEENDNTNNDEVIIVCNTQEPLQDLGFLKDAKNTIDAIDCGGRSSITQFTYNSETVFEVIICDQISDGQTLVYNCAGETICTFGGIVGANTCVDFEKLRTDKIILYGN